MKKQAPGNSPQFIIQNGNIYQFTTNIRNNTNININNAIINNNMIITTNNNNNNNDNSTQQTAQTPVPSATATTTTKSQTMPPKTIIQQNDLVKYGINTKKIIYKADYQQCQQAIQQQYQQKQSIVLQKSSSQNPTTTNTAPSVIMLSATNKNDEQTILSLNNQQQQQITNQQLQQKKQKLCYIPVNQASKMLTNQSVQQQLLVQAQQNQITQTVKAVTAPTQQIINKSINIASAQSSNKTVTQISHPQITTIASPTVAQKTTNVLPINQNIPHTQPQQQQQQIQAQQAQNNIQTEDLHQQPKIINELVLTDSRLFKKLFRNFNAKPQQHGQLQHQNDVLNYKTVKIGNLDHIVIDNDENLTNFKGDIEKLRNYAFTLATKLNKPVTIPAYILVKKNTSYVDDIENVLKEKSIKPLFTSNANKKRKLNDSSSKLVISNSNQQPKDVATLAASLPIKQSPIDSELRSLLANDDVVPHKFIIKEDLIEENKSEAHNLEINNGLKNDFIKQDLTVRQQQQQQQLNHQENASLNFINSNNSLTTLNNSEIDNLLSSLAGTNNISGLGNDRSDFDFNLDLFDSNSLINNGLNDIDLYQTLALDDKNMI